MKRFILKSLYIVGGLLAAPGIILMAIALSGNDVKKILQAMKVFIDSEISKAS